MAQMQFSAFPGVSPESILSFSDPCFYPSKLGTPYREYDRSPFVWQPWSNRYFRGYFGDEGVYYYLLSLFWFCYLFKLLVTFTSRRNNYYYNASRGFGGSFSRSLCRDIFLIPGAVFIFLESCDSGNYFWRPLSLIIPGIWAGKISTTSGTMLTFLVLSLDSVFQSSSGQHFLWNLLFYFQNEISLKRPISVKS